jgi:CheY-like chemotaxis protein
MFLILGGCNFPSMHKGSAMSTSTLNPADSKPKPAGTPVKGVPDGVDRRSRKRAKITAQVHVRAKNAPDAFEEVCKSIDVSRDGLLFTSARAGYRKGQELDVTFPYSSAAGSLNQSQVAEVVRVTEQPDKTHAIAVHFHAAKAAQKSSKSGVAADPFAGPNLAGTGQSTVTGAKVKQQSVVLAVEPDPRMAETMRALLQPDGYTVIIVANAEAALEVLRTTIPAVCLAEVESDGMSGQDLCLIIKRNERLQNVPVILLTRSAKPADYSASHQMGAVVCMAKPFKPERLLHVVRLVAPPPTLRNAYASRMTSGTIERTL